MKNYLIWHKISEYISLDNIKEISNCDAGYDFNRNFQILNKLYVDQELPDCIVGNVYEVLSLTKWGQINSKQDAICILFCVAIILASSTKMMNYGKMSTLTEEVIIAIDCANYLGDDWFNYLKEFFTMLRDLIDKKLEDEEYLALSLGILILSSLKLDTEIEFEKNLNRFMIDEDWFFESRNEIKSKNILSFLDNDLRKELWESYTNSIINKVNFICRPQN